MDTASALTTVALGWLAFAAAAIYRGRRPPARRARARGIDVAGVLGGRRPPCLACMGRSERRPLGSAVPASCLSRRWARRTPGSSTIAFSAAGERALTGTLCR